jgi:putative transposase
VRQCDLLGLAQSSAYYQPVGMSETDLHLMLLLDEQYTRTPFYGARRMTVWLREAQQEPVNHKRVARLLRTLDLEAASPKPRLSQPAPGHRVYPSLLQGVTVARMDQVWSTDITYIRLARGSSYLAAVLDWSSRYVLSWAVSVTVDTSFCLEALDAALEGGRVAGRLPLLQ